MLTLQTTCNITQKLKIITGLYGENRKRSFARSWQVVAHMCVKKYVNIQKPLHTFDGNAVNPIFYRDDVLHQYVCSFYQFVILNLSIINFRSYKTNLVHYEYKSSLYLYYNLKRLLKTCLDFYQGIQDFFIPPPIFYNLLFQSHWILYGTKHVFFIKYVTI